MTAPFVATLVQRSTTANNAANSRAKASKFFDSFLCGHLPRQPEAKNLVKLKSSKQVLHLKDIDGISLIYFTYKSQEKRKNKLKDDVKSRKDNFKNIMRLLENDNVLCKVGVGTVRGKEYSKYSVGRELEWQKLLRSYPAENWLVSNEVLSGVPSDRAGTAMNPPVPERTPCVTSTQGTNLAAGYQHCTASESSVFGINDQPVDKKAPALPNTLALQIVPDQSSVLGGSTFEILSDQDLPQGGFNVKFHDYGTCTASRADHRHLRGDERVPAARERGRHSIMVEVFTEAGDKIGECKFLYKDELMRCLFKCLKLLVPDFLNDAVNPRKTEATTPDTRTDLAAGYQNSTISEPSWLKELLEIPGVANGSNRQTQATTVKRCHSAKLQGAAVKRRKTEAKTPDTCGNFDAGYQNSTASESSVFGTDNQAVTLEDLGVSGAAMNPPNTQSTTFATCTDLAAGYQNRTASESCAFGTENQAVTLEDLGISGAAMNPPVPERTPCVTSMQGTNLAAGYQHSTASESSVISDFLSYFQEFIPDSKDSYLSEHSDDNEMFGTNDQAVTLEDFVMSMHATAMNHPVPESNAAVTTCVTSMQGTNMTAGYQNSTASESSVFGTNDRAVALEDLGISLRGAGMNPPNTESTIFNTCANLAAGYQNSIASESCVFGNDQAVTLEDLGISGAAMNPPNTQSTTFATCTDLAAAYQNSTISESSVYGSDDQAVTLEDLGISMLGAAMNPPNTQSTTFATCTDLAAGYQNRTISESCVFGSNDQAVTMEDFALSMRGRAVNPPVPERTPCVTSNQGTNLAAGYQNSTASESSELSLRYFPRGKRCTPDDDATTNTSELKIVPDQFSVRGGGTFVICSQADLPEGRYHVKFHDYGICTASRADHKFLIGEERIPEAGLLHTHHITVEVFNEAREKIGGCQFEYKDEFGTQSLSLM